MKRSSCCAGAAVLLGLLLSVLGACGAKVSGRYSDDNGAVTMVFKSGGKVEITLLDTVQEADYAVEDGKVKVTTQGQTQVLPIDGKGCLNGGFMLGTLCPR